MTQVMKKACACTTKRVRKANRHDSKRKQRIQPQCQMINSDISWWIGQSWVNIQTVVSWCVQGCWPQPVYEWTGSTRCRSASSNDCAADSPAAQRAECATGPSAPSEQKLVPAILLQSNREQNKGGLLATTTHNCQDRRKTCFRNVANLDPTLTTHN